MKISVVIPARDEEQTIRELLDCLFEQTRQPDEIVVADGGSIDRTLEIVRGIMKTHPNVHLIEAEDALPGRGRNLAAAAAQFEWLGFIDAGIRPETNWLESLAAKAVDDVEVVYGSWEPITDTFFKECAAIAYLPPPDRVGGEFLRPRSIASALMKRSVWLAAGGFPEVLRSAEDLLFMNRVEASGAKIVSAPSAIVHWQIKGSFVSTFNRFVSYSRNNIRAGLWRQWQAAIFKRYLLLLVLVVPTIWLGVRWLLVPLVLWLAMLLARSVVAIRRNRIRYPAGMLRNIRRVTVLVPLLAVLDAAAIAGTLHWLIADSLRRGDTVLREAGNGT